MKSKEIRELTDAELVSRIGELRREKLNLKIQLRTGQLEKTARCRTVRRDIARLLQEQCVRSQSRRGEIMSEATVQARGYRKERIGVVVSDVQDKTIVVKVDRRTQHPMYKKVVKVRRKFTAHDEKNEAKVGDTVRIAETRPLSKNKCWRLIEIVSRSAE